MRTSTILLSFLSLLTLTTSAPTSDPLDARHGSSTDNTASCPDYCSGTAYNATQQHTYICGDPRLGPKRLPSRIVLSRLIYDYDRFGGLCPGAYLAKWFNATTGYYNYPSDSGFQLTKTNAPIQGTITLPVGFEMDRFGSEYGKFVAPYGDPYEQRALPPSNLNTAPSAPEYPYNYHVYRVLRPLDVLAGPIAAWFGQPGQGVQYLLNDTLIGLVAGGFLERVDLSSL